jgi:hypothetical protein
VRRPRSTLTVGDVLILLLIGLAFAWLFLDSFTRETAHRGGSLQTVEDSTP